MKKAENIMRRFLAAGTALVLLAGFLPQAVYAEEPAEDGAVSIVYTGTEEGDGLNTYENGDAEAPDAEEELETYEPEIPEEMYEGSGGTNEYPQLMMGLDGINKNESIYFGTQTDASMRMWVVLSPVGDASSTASDADHLLLISSQLRDAIAYDTDTSRKNAWAGSNAQNWCTSFYNNWPDSVEKSAIAATSVNEQNDKTGTTFPYYWTNGGNMYGFAAPLDNERFFFISIMESGKIGTFENKKVNGKKWWFRSPSTAESAATKYVWGLDGDGRSCQIEVSSADIYARPAFNLDPEKVLFTRSCYDEPSESSEIASIPMSGSRYWKLTLLDPSRDGFAVTEKSVSAEPGSSVTLEYSGAKTGSKEYVSALLCDESGTAVGYGSLASTSASGMVTFALPDDLMPGNYTLNVFNEKRNGQKLSDFSSAFNAVELTLTAPQEETPDAVFSATGPDCGMLTSVTTGMNYSIDGGATWESISDTELFISGITAENGIQVYMPGNGSTTSDSDIQTISVSKAAQPDGLDKADCTENAGGKITGVTTGMEYKKTDASEWVAITGSSIDDLRSGTYLVRTAGNGTILASESQEITIMPYTEPAKYTVTVVNGLGDGKYAEGATVTITANAASSGFKFDRWTGTDGVIFADGASETTTFTMPAKAVIVTAGYIEEKSDPSLTPPSARTGLKYTGSAQTLVNIGCAAGGTIRYAVTNKGAEEPDAAEFTTAIPKATDVGDYYVWYRVEGDEVYNGTDSDKIEVSIGKGAYTGTKHVYTTVPENSISFLYPCTLPVLPDGAGYASEFTNIGGDNGFISPYQIQDDTKIVFNVAYKPAGTTATYSIPVTGASCYEDYEVHVTITASAKSEAKVSITGGDRKVTYGDTGVTLTGKVENPGGEGTGVWTWGSSDPAVAQIDNTGAVTIKKAGVANIKATYTSDTTTGATEICLTVDKRILGLTWSNTGFSFDGDPHKPVAVINGVINGDDCAVRVSGEKADVGTCHLATAEIYGTASGNYALPDERISCAFSVTKACLTDEMVILGEDPVFDGTARIPSLSVKIGDHDLTDQCTVTGNTGSRAGHYTLTVRAETDGNLTGSVSKDFNIRKKQTTPEVTVKGTYTYTGKTLIPQFTVRDPDGGRALTENDYTVAFSNNINAGKGRIIITPAENGNYDFTETIREFDIAKAVWNGNTTVTVERRYRRGDEVSDWIDLSELLPETAGKTEFGDPSVRLGNLNFVAGKGPRIEGDILAYTIASSTSTNTRDYRKLTVTANAGNYSNPFTIKITLWSRELALYEKENNAPVPRTSKDLVVGKSITLMPVFYGNVNNQKVTWSSSNPDVATVNQDGKVTALSAGKTIVTAVSEYYSFDTEEFSQCTITVTEPVTSLTLDQKSCALGTGESITVAATILPFTAVHPLRWERSSANVMVERAADGLSATITGTDAGKATVTAYTTDGSGKKASCSFTVGSPVPIAGTDGFTVTGKGNINMLAAGKTLAMNVNWPDNKKPANTSVIWSIEQAVGETKEASEIATISQKGVLSGLSEGKVRVVATCAGNSARVESEPVTVYVPVKSVALNVKSGTLSVSGKDGANGLQLKAFVTSAVAGQAATGTELGTKPVVEWKVDPKYKYPDQLSIDNGLVTANVNTTVKNIPVIGTVKAYNGYEKTLTCKVSVKAENPLKGIKISKKKLSIGEGNTATLTASLDPANPDGDQGYYWTSSNKKCVLVDRNTGIITAVAPGTAQITVTANGTVTTRQNKSNPSAKCTVTVTPSVSRIEFTNGTELEQKGLGKGKTYALKTQFSLTRSEGKAATTDLKWTSSNENVATVSQKGVIKAVAPGSVRITAASADDKSTGRTPSESVTFTVYASVEKVAIDKSKLTLGTQTGSRYGKVGVSALLPYDVTDPSIRWTAGNTKVQLAAIEKGEDPKYGDYKDAGRSVITGRGETLGIKALQPGTVKITGITTDGSNKKMTVTVTVRGEVTGLSLRTTTTKNGLGQVEDKGEGKYESTLKPGGSVTITPLLDINGISATTNNSTEKKAYADYKKYTDVSVSYHSSNANVVTVDKKGKISVKRGIVIPETPVTVYAVSADGKLKEQIAITVAP